MAKVFNETHGWNEMVHRHLGEVLYYYFVKVTHFDPTELQQKISALLKHYELGSVRAFELFGTYDLIIRAWLHPNIAKSFRDWLQKEIPYRLAHVFEVTDIDERWYKRADERALDLINERTVNAVQDHNKDLEKFIEYGLITERPAWEGKQSLIRFFVSVYFEGAGEELFAEDGRRFSSEISRELKRLGTIRFLTIDRGIGFSQMLLKCEAEDYFSITHVPGWISTYYKHLRARTETFLVHSPKALVGDERIGRATFKAIKGKDLWVNAVIPELYEQKISDEKQKWMIDFVTQVRGETHDVTQDHYESGRERDRELLRNCMLAYFHNRPSDASKTLFGLFADLEAYLRMAHKKLLFGVLKLNRESLLQKAKVEHEKKHLAIGDVLKMIAIAAKECDRKELTVPSGWEELIELRNKVMHGDFQFEVHLRPSIFATLAGIRQLIETIARETEMPYTGD